MKKKILYTLLSLGVAFIMGMYIYHQYQYKKFEEIFMTASLYGSKKIVRDNTFEKIKSKTDHSKNYKYSILLKTNNNMKLGDVCFITIFDKNFKITGGGSGGSILGNNPSYGIKNHIYLKFIPEKWIPNKKSAFYLIVEYEKHRQIRYYFEMTEKVENKKYTIYFKSYPPKMILNAKNEYIKD